MAAQVPPKCSDATNDKCDPVTAVGGDAGRKASTHDSSGVSGGGTTTGSAVNSSRSASYSYLFTSGGQRYNQPVAKKRTRYSPEYIPRRNVKKAEGAEKDKAVEKDKAAEKDTR
ncbi:hypothetical protein DPSP01_013536 [Paraphaeosphaeria sporulosa]